MKLINDIIAGIKRIIAGGALKGPVKPDDKKQTPRKPVEDQPGFPVTPEKK